METKIKVVLADDELLFRKGILFLLQRKRDIDVVYDASDGNELIDYLRKTAEKPDIILMDLKMPFLNGIEATKIIRNDFPDIKIIALSSYDTPVFILNMIQSGATSYLVKNAHPEEMVKTIREVHSKGFYYNESVIEVIRQQMGSKKKIKSELSEEFLTLREKEILKLICLQYSTSEISKKLFVSPRTIEGHRKSMLSKTKCKNMAGLVIFAIQNHIVSPDSLDIKI